MKKELLLSVSAKDCDWSYTRGTGAGGQKKNKTSSAVHCTHRLSGAHGYAEETRSQAQNKKAAFDKMIKTDTFQNWLKLECAKRTGQLQVVEDKVKREMNNIRVEVKENDKWIEVDKNAILD